ncbi:MAG: GtrA family protein [Clostridia bacterium]|nr:GtrA family protein [Clostridia bacterium]
MKKLYSIVTSWGFVRKIMSVPLFGKLLRYEMVMYILFGVLTSATNLMIFYICKFLLDPNTVLFSVGAAEVKWSWAAQAIAWLGAVLFAFVTNKLLVFESRDRTAKVVLKEFSTFIGGRILSFLIFEEGMFILLDNYVIPDKYLLNKIIIAVFVVIFNYIVGKFVSFRKKAPENENSEETVTE